MEQNYVRETLGPINGDNSSMTYCICKTLLCLLGITTLQAVQNSFREFISSFFHKHFHPLHEEKAIGFVGTHLSIRLNLYEIAANIALGKAECYICHKTHTKSRILPYKQSDTVLSVLLYFIL